MRDAVLQGVQEPVAGDRTGPRDGWIDAGRKLSWLLPRDDLRRLPSGSESQGRQFQAAAPGTQPALCSASRSREDGVLRGSAEGVVNSLRPDRPRLRLAPDSYRRLCQQVRERDGWRCQICGRSNELQVHHICPRSKLGDDTGENLITLCNTCHRKVHGCV